jgi:hypothetical protein
MFSFFSFLKGTLKKPKENWGNGKSILQRARLWGGGRIELLTFHTLTKKITTRANTQRSLILNKVNIS